MAVGLCSCSQAAPLCAYGDSLAKSSQLTQALDAYAEAQRAGEGDCADDGLRAVAEGLTAVRASDAKGRAAIRAGDTDAARAAFESSLKADRTDPVATVELQRLGSATSTPTPAPPVVVTAARPSSTLAWIGITAALAAALATLIAGWRLGRQNRRIDERRSGKDEERLKQHERAMKPLEKVGDLSYDLREAQKSLELLRTDATRLGKDLAGVQLTQATLRTSADRRGADLTSTMQAVKKVTEAYDAVRADVLRQQQHLELLAGQVLAGPAQIVTENFVPRQKGPDDHE